MTQPDLDRLVLITETGDEFALWTECTISDSFLDPCQTMSLSVGADETRFHLVNRLRRGGQFQVRINDAPQISGFIDSAGIESSHSGTSVRIGGRDILSPVVDSHIDRKLAVKKTTSLTDLAKLVLHTEFELPVTFGNGFVQILSNDDAIDKARNQMVGKPVKARPVKRRRKAVDPLKEIRPRSNEGAFAYLMRFAHRVGFHAWAQPDGQGVLFGSPNYDQDAIGELVNLRGGAGGANTIERASITSDNTSVPSHVYVYGKSSKPGDKSSIIGYAINEDAPFFKPFYVTDDESDDKDHADAYARFLLGKALRQATVYNVTVRGFSDPVTGAIYNVDTVINVTDEVCGVEGPMWVEKRTFRKSRSGTFTDLTLIPADTLLLDYYAYDSLPAFQKPAAARASLKAKTKEPVAKRPLTGLDYAVIAAWGSTSFEAQALEESAPYKDTTPVISNSPSGPVNSGKGGK